MRRALLDSILAFVLVCASGCACAERIQAEDPPAFARFARLQWLSMPAAELEFRPTAKNPHVYGVLMDWPIDGDTVATIVAFTDGSASFYLTTGFAIIGGIQHAGAREAASTFVGLADGFYDSAQPAAEFPFPPPGTARFWLLGFDGVRLVDGEIESMSGGVSFKTVLWTHGQDLLTQLRRYKDEIDKAEMDQPK